ncbi:colicin E1 family microcin immunity protein [Pseudomonas hormoni]|jgi:O-antigen/teichoic acid export membrane protein
MDKKYFIKNSRTGFLFLIIAIVAFYSGDELFYQDYALVIFMVLSTLLYPFSRYLISATAYKMKPRKFWRKIFPEGDISGTDALFIFACVVLAIPLGGSYLMYIICKNGVTKSPQ